MCVVLYRVARECGLDKRDWKFYAAQNQCKEHYRDRRKSNDNLTLVKPLGEWLISVPVFDGYTVHDGVQLIISEPVHL